MEEYTVKIQDKEENLQGIMNLTPEISFNQEVEVRPSASPP